MLRDQIYWPVASETFKEYVSPTAINEASILGWKHDIEDDETARMSIEIRVRLWAF